MNKNKYDALYARYSSHRQDDSTSIEVQIEQCEREAGCTLTHYIDRAKTGRAAGGRSQLAAMLADARAGRINRLFIFRFNRIGRNLAESATLIQELEDNGVQVISVTEGSDSFARANFLAMAEHFSRELSENTRAGLVKRHESGYHTGGPPPYGYKSVPADGTARKKDAENEKMKLVINEQEADTVRWIFRTYLVESIGVKELARRLEEKGIPTRRGAAWSFTTVRALLVNQVTARGRPPPPATDPDDECVSVEEILFRLREAFPHFEDNPELGRQQQQEKVDRLKRMSAPPVIVDHEQAAVDGAVYVPTQPWRSSR